MKAAALQMTSAIDVAANLATAARLLAQAAAAGAKLAVLPENFAFMGLMVVGGTIALRVPGESRAAAACLVYGADGALQARYDKIHLFDVDLPGRDETYRESSGIAPGHEVVVIDTPVGRAGLSVCYDMRFPELYRRMSAQGAQLFIVPAAFTVPTGRAHWDLLLRARAVENLCYVVASGQWGQHENGRETWGHSQIIDSWGEQCSVLPEGEGCALADIDLEQQAALRSRFPALTHRVLA